MTQRNILLTVFSLLLIITYVIIKGSNHDGEIQEKSVDLTDLVQSKIQQNEKLIDEKYIVLEPMTDDIKVFNDNLTQDFDILNPNSLKNEVDTFSGKSRESSNDVVERIAEYLDNPTEYKIQLRELQRRCLRNKENLNNLKKIIQDNHPNLGEGQFNAYYFELGLEESNFCERVATKKDVFWLFVKLARKGDEVAQLLLFEELLMAVNLKHFNIKKYPLEYMQLRDEAIEYLSRLARKGVLRASNLIAQIYLSKKNSGYDVIKPNLVLAYYYFSLAVKQANTLQQPYNNRMPDVIYEKLTDKQKIIADRMTKNI
jgi:hypothetical protein